MHGYNQSVFVFNLTGVSQYASWGHWATTNHSEGYTMTNTHHHILEAFRSSVSQCLRYERRDLDTMPQVLLAELMVFEGYAAGDTAYDTAQRIIAVHDRWAQSVLSLAS